LRKIIIGTLPHRSSSRFIIQFFEIFHTGMYQCISHFFSSKSVLYLHETSTGMDNRTSRCFLISCAEFSSPKSLDFYIFEIIKTVPIGSVFQPVLGTALLEKVKKIVIPA